MAANKLTPTQGTETKEKIMSTLYIYEADTMVIAAIVSGKTEKDCLDAVSDCYDWDSYGSTFSTRGLIDNPDAVQINA